MDEYPGKEPNEADERHNADAGSPPPAGSQPPSTPPGWVPPWNAPAGSPGQPATPPPPLAGTALPPPFPGSAAPPSPPAPDQWRWTHTPGTPPSPGTSPFGAGTQLPGSPQSTSPYASTPPGGGPYGGGPYGGGPYGGGPYGGGPYGGGPYGGGPYGGGPYGRPYGSGWQQGPPATPPRPVSRGLVTTIVVVAVLVAALVGGLVGHGLSIASSNGGVSLGPSATTPPSGAPSNASAIATAIDPDLVDIDTVINSSEGEIEGAGTGMVLTSTGEILTNNHVVEGEDSISITDIGNGKTYDATVVGYDRTQDVAVVQLVGASGLQTVPTGDSSSVAVGNGVVAIGNAGGTGGTPTAAAGTVTATDQSITATDEVDNSQEQLSGLIESNADIQEGDSGGPLVSAAGKVIGMDTAASSGFQFANSTTQGYSIPINTALNIAKEIEGGAASSTVHVGPTAFLGVEVVDASSSCTSAFGGGGGSGQSGALICQLVPGEPAADSSLQAGDVITGLAGQSVTSANSLTNVITTLKPSTTVTVTYLDSSGQTQTTNVTLASGAPQ